METYYVVLISAFVWSFNLPLIFARSNYYNSYGMRNESSLKIEVISARTEAGARPFWDEEARKLYYVDIIAQTVNRYDPFKKTTTSVVLDKLVTFVIPIKGERNKFVIGLGPSVAVMTWDGISRKPANVKILTTVINPTDGSRVNDAKADDFGRLWSGALGPQIGSITEYVPYAGILFRLNKDKTASIKARGITISNGIAWSLDNKKMYYAGSEGRVILVFDYDLLRGTISNAKILFDYKKNGVKGIPDGLTVDCEGKIWAASFQGAQVLRIDPETGRLLRSINFPSYQITSVAFGGPNYEELFVSSANVDIPMQLLEKYPLSGYIFRVTGLGVTGVPPRRVVL